MKQYLGFFHIHCEFRSIFRLVKTAKKEGSVCLVFVVIAIKILIP